MLADLRDATRQLRKAPGFTTTALITLSLGIGATTAIFTLVHQVMLKSLPVTKPAELWRMGDKDRCCNWGGYTQGDDGNFSLFSWEAYKHFRAHTPEFTGLAALLNSVRFNQIPSNTGLGLEMKVIASVVVGGAAITGGRGTVIGTGLGVMLLGAIGPALTFLGLSAFDLRHVGGFSGQLLRDPQRPGSLGQATP